MKFIKVWVEFRYSFLKLFYFRGIIVKMIRFVGDWVFFGNNEI